MAFRNVEVGVYALWAVAAVAALAIFRSAKGTVTAPGAAPGPAPGEATSGSNPADFQFDYSDPATAAAINQIFHGRPDLPLDGLVLQGWKIESGYIVNATGVRLKIKARAPGPVMAGGSGAIRDYITAAPSTRQVIQKIAAETSIYPGKHYDKRAAIQAVTPEMY